MGKVLLVDDHPLFRQALQAVIVRAQPDLEVVEARNLAEARRILGERPGITLVLLDLKMPDCGGFAGLLSLRADYPQAPIVIVSASEDTDTINRAIAFGAAGFIPKSSTNGEMTEALSAVLAGEVWTPNTAGPEPMPAAVESIASLSPAQLKILLGLKRGLLNKQIAGEIGVTEATIKAHMTILFRKMGVTNRTQAVIAAGALNLEGTPH
jgi:DNA-binding NarL/FixJ family response regulator